MRASFQQLKIRGDLTLWILYLVLIGISLLAYFTASSWMIGQHQGNIFAPLRSHTFHLIGATVLCYLMHFFPGKFHRGLGMLSGLGAIFWTLMPFLSPAERNDGARWANLFGVAIQTTEFVKPLLIYFAAYLLHYFRTENDISWKVWGVLMSVVGFCLAFITSQNLSTGLLISVCITLLLILGQTHWKKWLAFPALVIGGLVLYLSFAFLVIGKEHLHEHTSTQRIGTWINRLSSSDKPADPRDFVLTDKNRQEAYTHIAIARAKIWGVGLGNSEIRRKLPAAYADSIFAIIVEETGILGGGFTLLLFFLIYYRVCQIAMACRDRFFFLLCMGLGTMLCLQALISFVVGLGLFITGQPLPLVSQGGTSIFSTGFIFGVLLAISHKIVLAHHYHAKLAAAARESLAPHTQP